MPGEAAIRVFAHAPDDGSTGAMFGDVFSISEIETDVYDGRYPEENEVVLAGLLPMSAALERGFVELIVGVAWNGYPEKLHDAEDESRAIHAPRRVGASPPVREAEEIAGNIRGGTRICFEDGKRLARPEFHRVSVRAAHSAEAFFEERAEGEARGVRADDFMRRAPVRGFDERVRLRPSGIAALVEARGVARHNDFEPSSGLPHDLNPLTDDDLRHEVRVVSGGFEDRDGGGRSEGAAQTAPVRLSGVPLFPPLAGNGAIEPPGRVLRGGFGASRLEAIAFGRTRIIRNPVGCFAPSTIREALRFVKS